MKTLKSIKKNGKFDIEVVAGKPVVLDSRIPAEKTAILEQRVLKAVLSKQNNYDENYGLNINKVIGQRKGGNLVMRLNFEKLNTFFSKNSQNDKDCAVESLDINYSDDTTIQCVIYGKKLNTTITIRDN